MSFLTLWYNFIFRWNAFVVQVNCQTYHKKSERDHKASLKKMKETAAWQLIDFYLESAMYFQTEIINDRLNGYISILPVITFIYTNAIQQWYLKSPI